jgi:hypothetical protein
VSQGWPPIRPRGRTPRPLFTGGQMAKPSQHDAMWETWAIVRRSDRRGLTAILVPAARGQEDCIKRDWHPFPTRPQVAALFTGARWSNPGNTTRPGQNVGEPGAGRRLLAMVGHISCSPFRTSLDLEKTVTVEQLGSCPACPASRKKPDLRAIRRCDPIILAARERHR